MDKSPRASQVTPSSVLVSSFATKISASVPAVRQGVVAPAIVRNPADMPKVVSK